MDSGCSYTTIMVRIIQKLHHKEDDVMQWNTQAGKITTNLKFKIDFKLTEIRTTKIVMLYCHVYDSAKGGYDMILSRYLLT